MSDDRVAGYRAHVSTRLSRTISDEIHGWTSGSMGKTPRRILEGGAAQYWYWYNETGT